MDRDKPNTPIENLVIEYQSADDLVLDYKEHLSSGRVFLDTRRALELDACVRLQLSCPGLRRPIDVMGVVRWPGGRGPEPGVGIELADPEERERLGVSIARIRERDPALIARLIRILVVDDNRHVVQLIRTGLQGVGSRKLSDDLVFDVRVARNGRDALELLDSQDFDALIVDMYLPVLDGVHVITRVRQHERLSRIPIVAVSAGGAAAKDAALSAGADRFVPKPMRLRQITDVMDELLDIDDTRRA